MMKVEGSVVLVTGSNRGIGKAFIEALVEARAAKIYATARNLNTLKDIVALAPDRIVPLALDITQPEQIAAAARAARDVNLLVNNAGVGRIKPLFAPDCRETIDDELKTNCFGTFHMMQTFAPILKENNGGIIINVLSIAAVVSVPGFGAYSASKAALYALTRAARIELAPQKTRIIASFPGPIDTDMAAEIKMDKYPPLQVAQRTLEAVEQDVDDVYPDLVSEQVFAGIEEPLKAIDRQMSAAIAQS